MLVNPSGFVPKAMGAFSVMQGVDIVPPITVLAEVPIGPRPVLTETLPIKRHVLHLKIQALDAVEQVRVEYHVRARHLRKRVMLQDLLLGLLRCLMSVACNAVCVRWERRTLTA